MQQAQPFLGGGPDLGRAGGLLPSRAVTAADTVRSGSATVTSLSACGLLASWKKPESKARKA